MTGDRRGERFMKITREDVAHVAKLARLELDDTSMDKFVGQLGTVLEYIETLNSVDTEGVKPMSNAISMSNAFRQDEVKPHLDREDALANAPEKEDGSFVVPRVIG